MQRYSKHKESSKSKISDSKKGYKMSKDHKRNWIKSRWPQSKLIKELEQAND